MDAITAAALRMWASDMAGKLARSRGEGGEDHDRAGEDGHVGLAPSQLADGRPGNGNRASRRPFALSLGEEEVRTGMTTAASSIVPYGGFEGRWAVVSGEWPIYEFTGSLEECQACLCERSAGGASE